MTISWIFLASGQVAKVQPGNNEMLQQLLSAKQDQNFLKITLSDERLILRLKILPSNLNQSSPEILQRCTL